MRSQLVYSAGIQIQNRFLLSSIAMRAVKRLHLTATRVEETANQVFSDIASGTYIDVKMPEIKAQPAIEPLLIAPAA
jgi:hypothetical protein